jgi:hypothetical protein
MFSLSFSHTHTFTYIEIEDDSFKNGTLHSSEKNVKKEKKRKRDS